MTLTPPITADDVAAILQRLDASIVRLEASIARLEALGAAEEGQTRLLDWAQSKREDSTR